VRIQDKVGEWTGEFKIILEDGTEFCLKPKLVHKRKLQVLQKKMVDGTYTEQDLEAQDEQLKSILKQDYPEFSEDQINNVINLYASEILLELYFAWGWRDRDAWNALKEMKKEQIKMMKEESKKEVDNIFGKKKEEEKQ